MLNKVVHTLSRALNDLQIPAVRFNFRGVGASEGAYADGFGETEDALAVAAWARQRFPGADLWLAGFSFGAAVAIRAAVSSPCRQLISIAPPVSRMASLLGDAVPACPWLLVQGTGGRGGPGRRRGGLGAVAGRRRPTWCCCRTSTTSSTGGSRCSGTRS